MDILLYPKTVLQWSPQKQDAAKARLWTDFGLSAFFNEDFKGQSNLITDGDYNQLLHDFNVQQHFVITLSHKRFIKKSFLRFQDYFESMGLKEEQINKHDDSKLTSFLEIIGYTQRWIWNEKTEIWNEAWRHHFTSNSHHPEYYTDLDGKQENVQSDMEHFDLMESVIDMIACRWERQLEGKEDVKNEQLLQIGDYFLNRYTNNDRGRVKKLLKALFDTSRAKDADVL